MKSGIIAVFIMLLATDAAIAQVKNYPKAKVGFDDFKSLVAKVEPHRASRLVDLNEWLKRKLPDQAS